MQAGDCGGHRAGGRREEVAGPGGERAEGRREREEGRRKMGRGWEGGRRGRRLCGGWWKAGEGAWSGDKWRDGMDTTRSMAHLHKAGKLASSRLRDRGGKFSSELG